mmetsp:Transcript_44571/g.112763  ORF Transcript_44571/g.112763 Transcript_44571/m.112763 type:complete len:424 (-) Transcript_44571:139-1410(-)
MTPSGRGASVTIIAALLAACLALAVDASRLHVERSSWLPQEALEAGGSGGSVEPASALPDMHFKFTSFATPLPQEAAEFCVRYFGAQLLTHPDDFLAHRELAPEARAAGVRFFYTKSGWPPQGSGSPPHDPPRRRSFDIYFVHDPTKASSDILSVPNFNQYLHETHRFDLQENWDWYQDWHFCLWSDNVDEVLYRLLRDGVPIVTRSSSFYVELPSGITFQVLGRHFELVWTELFEFCRTTDGQSGWQPPIQLHPLPAELPPIPEMAPSHISFFSSHAIAARDALTGVTSGWAVNMTEPWQLTHRYSDGRCAMLGWVMFPEFQVHFVEQHRKYQGALMQVADVEEALAALHGDMSAKDAFFDNHPAFEVDDLQPFAAAMREQSTPHLLDSGDGVDSLFFMLPGGVIIRLVSAAATPERVAPVQ